MTNEISHQFWTTDRKVHQSAASYEIGKVHQAMWPLFVDVRRRTFSIRRGALGLPFGHYTGGWRYRKTT